MEYTKTFQQAANEILTNNKPQRFMRGTNFAPGVAIVGNSDGLIGELIVKDGNNTFPLQLTFGVLNDKYATSFTLTDEFLQID
jgi:hypothetical protein